MTVDTLFNAGVHRDVLGPVGSVTYDVDEVDLDLLRMLQADGRVSYVAMAGTVGLTPAAVGRRVQRLISSSAVRVGGLAGTRVSGQNATGSRSVGFPASAT